MKRTIVYAPNVGVGGGLVLLKAMLNAWPANQQLIAILDERGRSVIEAHGRGVPIHWVKSNLLGRWHAERLLARISTADDAVFCFHNLPPALPNRGKVLCYVHSPYVAGLAPLSGLSGWLRIRSALERVIAKIFGAKITRYIVQTPTMADALRRSVGKGPTIDIMPFVDSAAMPAKSAHAGEGREKRRNQTSYDWDFIYVSDGAPHKNHPTLFRAWELMAGEGVFPSLAVTLHPVRDSDLRKELDRIVSDRGVNIVDLGQVPHHEILQAYGKARALLFASYSESFGIPLIEAQTAGLPILAAELDFVRDVCEPAVTFDPRSARSIARAARRFLDGSPSSSEPMSPDEFVARLLDRCASA